MKHQTTSYISNRFIIKGSEMKVKLKLIDNEESALIWLTKADQENAEIKRKIDEYNQKYTNVVIYHSGNNPVRNSIEFMLKQQKLKGL